VKVTKNENGWRRKKTQIRQKEELEKINMVTLVLGRFDH
jgi:hypothetical protein